MVLQRWQSVYLLIAAVMLGLATFLPVFEIALPDQSVQSVGLRGLLDGSVSGMASAYGYFLLTAVSALVALVSIFKFKNLKLQKSLCSVEMLLIIVAYVVIALCYQLAGGIVVRWDIASLMPAFALICVFLAKSRIIHDYRLIHAADRLR